MINKNNKIKIIINIIKNLEFDKIDEYSAECSYYTILSFIPFMILLMSTIKYIGIQPNILIEYISKIIPSSMNNIVIDIIQEVYSKSLGTISISIIFTLLSAGRGIYAFNSKISSIFNEKEMKQESQIYSRLKSIIQTIIFIILIVVGLFLLVFGSTVISLVKSNSRILENFNNEKELLIKTGLTFVTFFIFLLIYKFIPRNKTKFKNQIYGAILGSILLNILSLIFSEYLNLFKGFSIIYGSLTTLILIMMWIYSCFFTVFLGAEINRNLTNIK